MAYTAAVGGIVSPAAGASANIQPPAGEVWVITALAGDANVADVQLVSGSAQFSILSLLPMIAGRLIITNTVYLRVTAGAGAGGNAIYTGFKLD